MKAFLFIDSLTNAGAQRQLANLALGMCERKHRVVLATYAPLSFFRSPLEQAGAELLEFDKAYRFDLSPSWQLYRAIKHHRPDVVVAFLRTPSFYAEMAKLLRPGMRLIVSERAGVDLRGFTFRDRIAGIGHHIANRVTTNSHDFHNLLVTRLPLLKKKSAVIYNGIDEAFFRQGEIRLQSPQPTDNQQIPAYTRFCVVAARANRQKAPLPLLKAIIKLQSRGINEFSIDWIGPVDFHTGMVQQVSELLSTKQLTERWNWRGPSSDVQHLYTQYDGFILPSLYEGVANTLCEAMSAGLPVVATDIADNRRILSPDQAGLVCESDNPESLADAIEVFLQMNVQQRSAMAARAHAQARRLFSMDRFVNNWEQLCLSTM